MMNSRPLVWGLWAGVAAAVVAVAVATDNSPQQYTMDGNGCPDRLEITRGKSFTLPENCTFRTAQLPPPP